MFRAVGLPVYRPVESLEGTALMRDEMCRLEVGEPLELIGTSLYRTRHGEWLWEVG